MSEYERYVQMAAKLAGTGMVLHGLCNNLLPSEILDELSFSAVRARLSSRHTVVIDQTEGLAPNHLYDAACAYLAARATSDAGVRRHRACSIDESSPDIGLTMDHGEETVDAHDGVTYTWRHVSRDPAASLAANSVNARGRGGLHHVCLRSFELSFHKKHKEKALASYLPFVLDTAKAIKDSQRNLKMHMVQYDAWTAVDFRHPSTFDTLAMDAHRKKPVVDDLERFVKRKDYYKRTGRAWKRGYLLYGPPGTGKSSLVAAMANYLKFDVYDLELTEVNDKTRVKRIPLAGTRTCLYRIRLQSFGRLRFPLILKKAIQDKEEGNL